MKIKTFIVIIFTFAVLSNYSCSYVSGALSYNDPLTAEEHNNLGVAYEAEGKYKLAEKQYKRAIDIDESLITPVVNLGNVYYKQGKYKKAEKNYIKALNRDNKNIEAANNLGTVYLETAGDYDNGIEYLVRAMPPPEIAPAYALDTLGMLYAGNGNYEKAVVLLQLACSRAGDDQEMFSEIDSHLEEIGEKGCPSN